MNATANGFTPTMHLPFPVPCSSRDRRPFVFFSSMVQPRDPPLFSSRFEGVVLVAIVRWLLEGWNQLRARISCFWSYMCKYVWYLRNRCYRWWHGIPEPPARPPPHIDLTDDEVEEVLGRRPRQQPQEGFGRPTRTGPPGDLGKSPGDAVFLEQESRNLFLTF